MSPDLLIAFENDIAAEFNAGKIAAPVHFAGGNEFELIGIFESIKPEDWVLCSWRSHYHCLLKGVPPDKLKSAIVDGRSIALCFPEHKILSSAIVGGICPIAVGLGWAIKRRGNPDNQCVNVFVGDMTAMSGIYHECVQYVSGHCLPVCFWTEDNGLSVCTNTQDAWGRDESHYPQKYTYKMNRSHVGTGQWVRF